MLRADPTIDSTSDDVLVPNSNAIVAKSSGSLPPPVQVLNLVGLELPLDEGEIRPQDHIDQTKYFRLGKELDQYGWHPLIEAAYDDEKIAESPVFKKLTKDQWIRYSDLTLATMEPEILAAVIRGNLVQTLARDKKLLKVAEGYNAQSKYQPSIYVRQLTLGNNYDNLTVDQAKQLATTALQYANQLPQVKEAALKIDCYLYPNSWYQSLTDSGERALLLNESGDFVPEYQRKLATFGRVIRDIAMRAEAAKETHIPGLYHVGYSINAAQRKKQHNKLHDPTHFLIRFTHAVTHLYGWQPHVDLYTVSMLTTCGMAPVAEMLLARLLHAYYFAGGFNNVQAGENVASVQVIKDWSSQRLWVTKKTRYQKNLQDEIHRREACQRREFTAEEEAVEDALKLKNEENRRMRQERDKLWYGIDAVAWRRSTFFSEALDRFNRANDFIDKRPNGDR